MRRALTLLIVTVGLLGATIHGTAAAPPPDPGGGGSNEDTTPPVITVNRPAGSVDGWHDGPVTISMTVSDSHVGARGVARATYTLSGATTGTGTFEDNRAQLQISNDGSTRIHVEAWDRADNVNESTHWVGIDTSAPTISIEPVLSGMVFARGQKVPITYRCTDHQVGVDTCTAPVASGADLSTHQLGQFAFQVSSRDRLGNARLQQVSYTVVEPYFAVVEAPQVEGEPIVGERVAASAPRFSPVPDTVDYQWRRDGVPIAGATQRYYRLQPADAGRQLTVLATARKEAFQTATATSSPVTVQPGALRMASTPVVEGTPRVGGELRAVHDVVQPESAAVEYRWFRGAQRIAGASGVTYRPTASDLGQRISVEVAATATGYAPDTWRSAPTSAVVVAGPIPVSGSATITGTARVASVLTARPPSFGAGSTIRYQWLRNGAAIKGATGRTYRLQPSDRGRRLSVRVTGSRPGYTSTARTSASTRAVVKATPSVRTSVRARGKRGVRINVTVASTGLTPTGRVTIKRGSRIVAKGRLLRGGKVSVNLSRQKKGRTRYTVIYTGSDGFNSTSARTATVRVR